MTFGSIAAALLLLLAIFPQPFLWLDTMYHNLLARSIVKASEGSVDLTEASHRIRDAEVVSAQSSARIFGAIAFVAGSWIVAATGSYRSVRLAAVFILAASVGALVTLADRIAWARIAAAVLGIATVIALR